MLESNKIYNLSCEEGLKQIEDASIDFVCIDPPYTDGETDCLEGHKIQTKLNISQITKEHFRVLKDNSFYAVFGQMPTILSWYNAALESGFKFRIDIIWAKKRAGIGGNLNLKKSHELVYIFSKGNVNYYKTKGVYSDVSQGLVEHNIMDIETIFRRLSEYEYYFKYKKETLKHNIKNANNDSYFIDKGGFGKIQSNTREVNAVIEKKSFNSVWAFPTHNQSGFNNSEFNVKHPTVKSIPVIERLIELCTPENPEVIVLDSFLGSGTTFLGSQNTNRKCIGFEIDKEYYSIAQDRILNNMNLFNYEKAS